MIAEGNRCFAQALPSVPEIIREILDESSFGGRPTVVLFSVLDPLLAVVTDRAYVKILPAILRHFEVANSLADENSGVPHQNRPNCRKWLLVRKEYYPAIIETTVQVH